MKEKTILICDDDESIIEVLGLILKNHGFTVITEQNSRNIFAIVERGRPDLLLLDLWMPAMNGDKIIRMLKSDPATSSLPVILVSASLEAKDIAEEAGADGFLAKPFQMQELIGVIESNLA